MSTTTLRRYCLCGAAMQVRSTPPDLADRLAAEFDERHTGDDHGPATQQQAADVRRRADRQALAADFAEAEDRARTQPSTEEPT